MVLLLASIVLFVKVSVVSCNTIVPDAFGKLIVLSAVGSITPNTVSLASAVEPSNVNELVISIVVELTVVVVPFTVKSPVTVKLFPIVTSLGKPTVIVPELSPTSTSFAVPEKVIVPPKDVAVDVEPSEIVIDEFVKLALPIFDNVFEEPLIVLLVKVSVVSLPTNVSVLVGKVIVPLLLIVEIIGDVNVLFVSVCVPVVVTTVLSIAKVVVSPDTVELMPVPPKNCKVSPNEIVDDVELSSTIVIEELLNAELLI